MNSSSSGKLKLTTAQTFGALPLILLFFAPALAALWFLVPAAINFTGWKLLFAHPQIWSALQISIFTGVTATILSVVFAIILVAGLHGGRWWPKLSSFSGGMLAVPHVAAAIAMAFLIMPSGVVARLMALALGWQEPPNWVTVHDPYGLTLILVLILKETPFLMWIIAQVFNQDDVQQKLAGQHVAAQSLGHGDVSIWLRIYLPQILPKMKWPLIAVFIYATTVVDVAIVVGPTQPPTLAEIIWADLNSAQVSANMRGAAGAWFLTTFTLVIVFIASYVTKLLKPFGHAWITRGPASQNFPQHLCRIFFSILIISYGLMAVVLLLLSVAQFWPFPQLLPLTFSAVAWHKVISNPAPLFTSLALALSSCVTALGIIILYLETQSQHLDKYVIAVCVVVFGLPSLLLGLGQYRAFLQLGLTGTSFGLFLAHLLPATAYMFIVLVAPYRAFDPHWQASASGLLASFNRYFYAIKLPLMKAPIWASLATGFAVSFVQFVPAQLIAAGRFSTLPMEAISYSSGTNRPLLAAFSLLLMVPPFLVFWISTCFSKSRWTTT